MYPKSHSFFFIFCLVILASCSKEKTITFSEETLTTPENTIVDINIPQAVGDSEIALQINKVLNQHVSTALQLNQEEESINTVEDQINSFNTEYNTFKNQFPESSQEWEAQIDGEVMYETPELISISLTSYTNTGGAHGILVISFLNFNGQTGELIETDKLFNDQDEFFAFAKPYFDEEISNKKDLFLDSENFVLPQNIGYSTDGLILLYNTYEIAPYAAGITEFIIPFNKANSYLKFDGF